MSDSSKQTRFYEIVNPKNIKKGVFLFLSITIISLTAIFFYTNTGKTLAVWNKLDWRYGLLCFVFVFNDLWIGGLRNHVFAKEFKPGIPSMVAMKANVANIFLGAVTPSQTGGGVAHWYVFWKNGLKTPDFIILSFINFISTIIFFLVSGYWAKNKLQGQIPEGIVSNLANYGFSVFATIGILIVVSLIFPKVIGLILEKIGKLIKGIIPDKAEKLIAFSKKTESTMYDYQQKTLSLFKRKPWLIALSFIITILLYFNKYALAFFIVLAFGLEVDFWTVIALQSIVHLLLYFAPSPGGSGIAEVGHSALMSNVIDKAYTGSFTLIQRSIMILIPALLGAYVIIKTMNQEKAS